MIMYSLENLRDGDFITCPLCLGAKYSKELYKQKDGSLKIMPFGCTYCNSHGYVKINHTKLEEDE